jgi:glycerol-3-phosphate dehydrogenase (NAD(P)+)
MTRIAIIGAGSWGTALSIMAARAGHKVQLWSRNTEVVNSINDSRINPKYLSGIRIPSQVSASASIGHTLREAQLVLLATPSHAARALLNEVKQHIEPSAIIVSVAKGIEIDTGKRISEIVCELMGDQVAESFVCLSGPSFAKEVVVHHPTAIVAASRNESAARTVQAELSHANLRIYTNIDVVGTELGGSVKNVMAIAAGMTAGLGFGSNSVAALITRGLAEMTRLALSQGAQIETLSGLAGLGDLVLTCTGSLSRNRYVGEQLGKGQTLEQITAGMNEVAEGIKTSRAVKILAEKAGIEMPITNVVEAVLYDGLSAKDAVTELMSRPLRAETF